VNQPHCALIGQQRFVEKPLGARERFVDGAPDHVQVRADASRGCSST
jgi:hypothetical protein